MASNDAPALVEELLRDASARDDSSPPLASGTSASCSPGGQLRQAGGRDEGGSAPPADEGLTSLLDFTVAAPAAATTTSVPELDSRGTRDSNDVSQGSRGGIRAHLMESATSVEGECNIIVAGLTRDIDDDGLKAMFTSFGVVFSATVMRHVGTGVSRGFGFVLFAKQADGDRAIAAMHGSRCGPNVLNVHRSHHNGTLVETNAVFVRNLPLDVTSSRIVEFFSPIAVPNSVEITADTSRDAGDAPTGKRYRVATVAFPDIEAARRVVKQTHNTPFPGSATDAESPLVIVKFAESPEYRRKRQHQRVQRGSSSTTPPSKSVANSPHGSQGVYPYAALNGTPQSSTGGSLPSMMTSQPSAPALGAAAPMQGFPGSNLNQSPQNVKYPQPVQAHLAQSPQHMMPQLHQHHQHQHQQQPLNVQQMQAPPGMMFVSPHSPQGQQHLQQQQLQQPPLSGKPTAHQAPPPQQQQMVPVLVAGPNGQPMQIYVPLASQGALGQPPQVPQQQPMYTTAPPPAAPHGATSPMYVLPSQQHQHQQPPHAPHPSM